MFTIPYELWEKYLIRTIPNSIEREEHMKEFVSPLITSMSILKDINSLIFAQYNQLSIY